MAYNYTGIYTQSKCMFCITSPRGWEGGGGTYSDVCRQVDMGSFSVSNELNE